MKVNVDSINGVLSKFGFKLEAKEGKVALSKESPVKLMAEATTADGQMIATPADEWANGVEVFIVDADGNPSPAPDGEYTLDNGSKIVVAGGVATEVTTVEVETETEMSSDDIKAVLGQMGEQINALQEQVNNLTTERDTATAELAKVKEANTSLTKQVTELSKAPAAKTAKEEAKTNLKKEEKPAASKPFSQMNYLERIKAQMAS